MTVDVAPPGLISTVFKAPSTSGKRPAPCDFVTRSRFWSLVLFMAAPSAVEDAAIEAFEPTAFPWPASWLVRVPSTGDLVSVAGYPGCAGNIPGFAYAIDAIKAVPATAIRRRRILFIIPLLLLKQVMDDKDMHFRINHFPGERKLILFVSCGGVKHVYGATIFGTRVGIA